ncbi:hypothetical protein B6D29_02690 [Microgenomates bacterium UTCPR1]|nr:MAG: hypothetical protein B6D29_02690 [Microgenomates bacterium UTCPR1]
MIKLVNLKSKYSFYCDENFSFISTGFLRNKGFNVKHASDYGYVNSDSKKFNDERQLKIATKLNRVLLTLDEDFRRLNKEKRGIHHSGVVVFICDNPNKLNNLLNRFVKLLKSKDYQLHNKITIISSKNIS